jgi:hypothetical protein
MVIGMSDIRTTLRAELAATTAAIPSLEGMVTAAQERLRFAADKAAQITVLLAMLDAEAKAKVEAETPTVPLPPAPKPPPPEGKVAPKNQRMEEEITALLSLRGTVHRLHILQHLIEKELMGHEKQPLAHLAAFLSGNKDKFASDGKGNFSLRRPRRVEAPQSIGEAVAAVASRSPAADAPGESAGTADDAQ